jgi:hypothetical protein
LQEKFSQPTSEVEERQVACLFSQFPNAPANQGEKFVGQSTIAAH